MRDLFIRRSRLLGALVVAVIPALVSAPGAQAALISTSACDASALTQPFAQWGDTDAYKLVPGGSFEGSTSGWRFTSGARVVAGSEPYGITGSVGASSLLLPDGASAQSPYTCVNAGYPTFRFVGRNNGLLSTLLVQVVYQLPLLGEVAVPVGVVALSGSWAPTPSMLTAAAVPGGISGGTVPVALRFTALTGSSQVDDAFVDPRMH
jgi:hypothetical protein